MQNGMGWIIVDALDSLMLMNLTAPLEEARSWVRDSLDYSTDHEVNTFETTIRMLGGLLSAHHLSCQYPELAFAGSAINRTSDGGDGDEGLYLHKAIDLADRLLGAFGSPTGIPYASVNLRTSRGIPSHMDMGASSTSEATTVQLELKYLSHLTGDAKYWRAAERVMEAVDEQGREGGLLPILVHPDTGSFLGNHIRLGSRGDSYYEYLIKQYLQTAEEEPIYLDMWDEALAGIRKYLLMYTERASLAVVGERPFGLGHRLSPKMDHLVCFLPGSIALGATRGLPITQARQRPWWSAKKEEEILLAKELTKTCWTMYLQTDTGLSPEITHFEVDSPPRMEADVLPQHLQRKENKLVTMAASRTKGYSVISDPLDDSKSHWRDDLSVRLLDRHNLQRPETAESLFYMYRILGDNVYREWGWDMFVAFINHTAITEDVAKIPGFSTWNKRSPSNQRIRAFTSLDNVMTIPPNARDNMESFWLAETLKYFYLLFSPPDVLSLDTHVFNTEAHPFPRFHMGDQLKTGWQRKNHHHHSS